MDERGFPMKLFCFGFGYSAQALARKLSGRADHVTGTHTGPHGSPGRGITLLTYRGDGARAEIREALQEAREALLAGGGGAAAPRERNGASRGASTSPPANACR